MKKDFITNNKLDTSSLVEAVSLIEKARYILIVTHVNPDPDTISSALALSNYLAENRIKHKVYNIRTSDIPKRLDFLSRFEKITDVMPKFYDLMIFIYSDKIIIKKNRNFLLNNYIIFMTKII